MRRSLSILVLSGLAVLGIAGDAFAQHGWSGGRGNAANFSRGGRGAAYSWPRYGSSSYYGSGANYLDYGYQPGYQPYQGPGMLGAGIIANGYYYSTPYSGFNSGAYSYAAPMDSRQSFYYGPGNEQQRATMRVVLPTAEAQVWFENTATIQRGTDRVFTSPPLESGRKFTYTIKARWVDNGHALERTRQVNVQAGQAITVNFDAGETLPVPVAFPRN